MIFSSSFALLSALPSLHMTNSLSVSCTLSLSSFYLSSLYSASFFSSFFNLSRYFLLLSELVNMALNKIKIADWTQRPRWPTGYSEPKMQQFTAHAQSFLLVRGGASLPPKTSLAFVAVFSATKRSSPRQKQNIKFSLKFYVF